MANTPPPFDTSKIIRCFTTQHMNKLKSADPSLSGRLNEYETRLQENIKGLQSVDDTICYKEFKGEIITLPYKGARREWKLYSSQGGNYCYRVIKP